METNSKVDPINVRKQSEVAVEGGAVNFSYVLPSGLIFAYLVL